MQQISSLSEELLRAKQIGTSQTERADYLEDQCTLLREKVNDLSRIVAQKKEEQIKDGKTVGTAVQTDDASKASYLYLPGSINIDNIIKINWLIILNQVVTGGK